MIPDTAGAKCIHELFQQQAEFAPDCVALIFEEQQLTYRDLNARANQLAHYLIKLGVGPDEPVGLCLERSVELIVGLLAILKAGGAYVPLDPGLPPVRLGMILEEAGVRVLVSRGKHAEILGAQVERVVRLDTDAEVIAQESLSNPVQRVCEENLAYVVFTSGSTGRPKGVAVEHRQIVNYVHAIWERLDLPVRSSFAMVSTIAADLGNTALFPALCKGGILHLLGEERSSDPAGLAEYFRRYQIDCLKIVPSHLSAMLTAANAAGVLPRQRLVLGGEACSWSLVERIGGLSPECVVLNHYGPTEATVGALTYRLSGDESERISETVPLGRPLGNVQSYILDEQLQPVAIGAAGELHLGGAGLARGYINRADATAEKFIPNPLSGTGERLYKTGDRARYLSDGQIEFLGRIDNQVKIRGYRIELGEIETVIGKHSGVRQVVVTAREDEPGDRRLVAYVVADLNDAGNQEVTGPALIADLRQFVANNLPKHMMPSAFILLNELPLTPNGKIDRQSLPAPSAQTGFETAYVGPRTTVEEVLTTIWKDVLKLEEVGINDNFFHVGGHSLVAVRLFNEIEAAFQIKLPLATLFEAPTIAQLAAKLQRDSRPSWSSLVAIQPNGKKPPLFCVHACGAHVFIYRPLAAYFDQDQPVYGLQAQGIDGTHEPYTHIKDMAAHYIREIRDFEPHGPYYLAGDTLGGLIAFEMAHQLTSQREEIGLLAMFDTFCPLPLSIGPRALSHLSHLKQLGAKKYFLAASSSLAKRLGLRFPDYGVSSVEQEFADGVSASGDAVQRTEWAIYLATQVNYTPPKEPLPLRITYFFARDSQYRSGEQDTRRNWKRGAAEFEVHVIPGRHNTIRTEPHVAVLAEKLISCLARAQERDPRYQKQERSIPKVSALAAGSGQ